MCAFGFPDLFTTFFSDSISNWVQTIVESDGETGLVGSGVGRVELSICKEIEKPKEETVKGGYQVRALKEFHGCSSVMLILALGNGLSVWTQY